MTRNELIYLRINYFVNSGTSVSLKRKCKHTPHPEIAFPGAVISSDMVVFGKIPQTTSYV
jgi:hypothetical protein